MLWDAAVCQCASRSYQPLLEQGHVFGQVVPLQLVLVPLLADCIHLAPQLPQLLLEQLRGPVGLTMLVLTLELVQLLRQGPVLLLQVAYLLDEAGEAVVKLLQLGFLVAARGQELLVDGLGQGEVHLIVREARGLGGGTGPLLVVGGGAGGHRRRSRPAVAASRHRKTRGNGRVGGQGDGVRASKGAPVGGGGH